MAKITNSKLKDMLDNYRDMKDLIDNGYLLSYNTYLVSRFCGFYKIVDGNNGDKWQYTNFWDVLHKILGE